jgi:hypothetical protein
MHDTYLILAVFVTFLGVLLVLEGAPHGLLVFCAGILFWAGYEFLCPTSGKSLDK